MKESHGFKHRIEVSKKKNPQDSSVQAQKIIANYLIKNCGKVFSSCDTKGTRGVATKNVLAIIKYA